MSSSGGKTQVGAVKSVSDRIARFGQGFVLAGIILLGGAARAQDRDATDGPLGRTESPIYLDQVEIMRVSPHGVVEGGGAGPRGGCNVVASHTDANFSGGSFIVEAGFAEQEWLAASYTLAATSFPIKINLAECIFATSGSTVPTTTRWSIGFWSGTPSTGTPVALFSADDVILPYIRIPPGTNGVNVQFSIDPGDPNQLIINDSPTHKFSFGFRVDHHNQQTQNPCFSAPPTCCNAFPTADVSGLQHPADNWLNGVNCGPFGCPANGGWASFSALPSFCRPSGDWVMRVTWSSINCQPGVGPCCLNGACQVRTQTECGSLGGQYQGDGSSCAGINCPQPTQACCFSGGGCIDLTPSNCSLAGGTAAGPGTSCAANSCNPTGACCIPNGNCLSMVSPATCAQAGGTYRGNNSTCQSPCTAACCFATTNHSCLELARADCSQAPGATWHFGVTCADSNGNGTADVCEPAPCPGDVNGDGHVDLNDLAQLLANFGRASGATLAQGDLDGDHDVDLNDLSILLARFGASC